LTDDSILEHSVRNAIASEDYDACVASATDSSYSDDDDSDVSESSSVTTGGDVLPGFSASLLGSQQPGFVIFETHSFCHL